MSHATVPELPVAPDSVALVKPASRTTTDGKEDEAAADIHTGALVAPRQEPIVTRKVCSSPYGILPFLCLQLARNCGAITVRASSSCLYFVDGDCTQCTTMVTM